MAGARGGAALDGAVPPVPASHAETRAVLTLAVQRAPDTRTRGYNVLIIKLFIIISCTINEKASWLKVPTAAFTFKTLLRHYAKQALTPIVSRH